MGWGWRRPGEHRSEGGPEDANVGVVHAQAASKVMMLAELLMGLVCGLKGMMDVKCRSLHTVSA